MRRILPFLAAAFLAAGCRGRDSIVAKVGPLKITESEFQRKLAEVAQDYQSYVATPNGRRQFLDILIREKLILAAAQGSGVPKSVDFRVQWDRLKAEEEERLREGRDYLLTRMWLENLRSDGALKVGDDEIRDYHRRYPMETEVRHILCASPVEAEELGKKARAGAGFAVLARDHSLDAASAADGGRLTPSLYGETIIPELQDIVMKMRVGEVAGPIKSKLGYHVLKKEVERRVELEEVRDRIARLLEKQKLDRYLQSVQEKFPVEVVDEQFK
ncbi:MAG: peptidylprolyl isomerase [Elusimicrobia bacterium]|nr:peptidylprolyl isomerase [Elusimicrobiota bacterium]